MVLIAIYEARFALFGKTTDIAMIGVTCLGS